MHGVLEFEFFLEDGCFLFRARCCFVGLDQVVFRIELCVEDQVLGGAVVPHVRRHLSMLRISEIDIIAVVFKLLIILSGWLKEGRGVGLV